MLNFTCPVASCRSHPRVLGLRTGRLCQVSFETHQECHQTLCSASSRRCTAQSVVPHNRNNVHHNSEVDHKH
jgi:hypothetical protein